MSDASTFIDSALSDPTSVASEIRLGLLASFGVVRRKTVLVVTATGTLAEDVDELWADLTAGAFTYNLPASPADGDHYVCMKSDASGNALTVGRNGKTINGAGSDITVTTQWASKTLTWSATANTWWSR